MWTAVLLAAGPCIASPTIFSLSDPVGPGETAIVTGDGLGALKKVIITKIKDDPHSSNGPVERQEVSPIEATNESVKFTVPKDFGPGVYHLELVSDDGTAGGYLNAPTVYWVQGDRGPAASAGGWVRVLGRNIARSSAAAATLTPLPEGHASGAIALRATAAGLWDATFALPPDTPAGSYRLSLWNGQGDGGAIRDAGAISIERPAADVRPFVEVTRFGAKGDGRSDDLNPIRAALADAEKNGGGTVFFPRGRYLLSGELEVPPNVTLKGEARNLVSLNWPQFDKAPPALIGGFRDFAVKDLTLFAANYRSVISGGFETYNQDRNERPRNIEIDNVLIRASTYRGHLTAQQVMQHAGADIAPGIINAPVTVQLTGRNLKIINSDIYGSGSAFLLLRPEGAYVAHNEIYNGRVGWYSITGADGVILEDNRITGGDMQSTGGGINTFDVPSSQNVLFSNNRFSLMHGWDREAITSDGSGGYYFGPVVTLGASELSLTGPLAKYGAGQNSWQGAGVFIVAGHGTGQYAQVASYDNGKVTLDRRLKVSPQRDSLVTIVSMQQNYLVIGNSFSDTGVAVQFYGTSLNHVVADNTSVRSSGFLDKGLFYEHFQPSWYNQFLHNRIVEGNLYDPGGGNIEPAIASVGVSGYVTAPGMPPLTRGIVVRGNDLKNNAEIDISGGNIASTPGAVDVVVEHNSVARGDHGVVMGRGVLGAVVRENRLIEIGQP
jgi:hypothetical protein